MKNNGISKVFKVVTTATLISMLTAGTAFAADGDIYVNNGTHGTSFVERSNYLNDLDKVRQAVFNQEEYCYEFAGRIYDLSTIATRTANLSGNDFSAELINISNDSTVTSETVESFTGAITSVSLDKTTAALSVGEKAKLIASVAPSDATDKSVI